MAIQRKPKPIDRAAQEAFIAGAPDAAHSEPASAPATYDKGIAKGHKRQISLTIAPEILRRVDEIAKRTGQARAAVINMAIYRALEGDIFK
jgi:hypothetical protein